MKVEIKSSSSNGLSVGAEAVKLGDRSTLRSGRLRYADAGMVSSAVYAVFKESSEPRRLVAMLAISVVKSLNWEAERSVRLSEKEKGSGVGRSGGGAETVLSWR